MPHDHDHSSAGSSPFEELIKLQNSFQESLSQATMNYLRQLQGLVGPVTPGTVVQSVKGGGITLKLAPGAKGEASVNVENRQRVHSLITPMLTPLVSDSGATWFVEAAFTPPTALLATDDTIDIALSLTAPKDVPLGVYRGAVLIYGCADGVIPFEVTVARATRAKAAAKTSATRSTKAAAAPKKKAPRKAKVAAARKS